MSTRTRPPRTMPAAYAGAVDAAVPAPLPIPRVITDAGSVMKVSEVEQPVIVREVQQPLNVREVEQPISVQNTADQPLNVANPGRSLNVRADNALRIDATNMPPPQTYAPEIIIQAPTPQPPQPPTPTQPEWYGAYVPARPGETPGTPGVGFRQQQLDALGMQVSTLARTQALGPATPSSALRSRTAGGSSAPLEAIREINFGRDRAAPALTRQQAARLAAEEAAATVEINPPPDSIPGL